MAWTTGGATNTRRNATAGVTVGAANTALLVAGWFFPTTLTAGRCLWSMGSIWGCRIATTTSELNLDSDNVTDGLWLTSGLNLTATTWRFIAWMFNTGTAPAASWRVWAGTVDTAPTEVTVLVPPAAGTTAAAGAFTGSTGISISNRGAGTVAFIGDTGDMVFVSSASATAGPLGVATAGTITQDEADKIYRSIVVPMWLGDAYPPAVRNLSVAGIETTFIPGDLSPAAADTQHVRTISTNVLASVLTQTTNITNSPTKSAQRSPVAMRGGHIGAQPLLRR